MDSNPCLVCDQENWQIISERDRKGAQLTTVLCRGCGLVSHACVPETDEIEEFYSDHYRKQYKHFDVPAPSSPQVAGVLILAPGLVSRPITLRLTATACQPWSQALITRPIP